MPLITDRADVLANLRQLATQRGGPAEGPAGGAAATPRPPIPGAGAPSGTLFGPDGNAAYSPIQGGSYQPTPGGPTRQAPTGAMAQRGIDAMNQAAQNARIVVHNGVAQLQEVGEQGIAPDDDARRRLIDAHGVGQRDMGAASESDVRAFLRQHGSGAKVPDEVPAVVEDPEVAFGGPLPEPEEVPLEAEAAPVEEAALPEMLLQAPVEAPPRRTERAERVEGQELEVTFRLRGPALQRFYEMMDEVAFSEEVILHDIDVTPNWLARYLVMNVLRGRMPGPAKVAQTKAPRAQTKQPKVAEAKAATPEAPKEYPTPPASVFFPHPEAERVPSGHTAIHSYYTARGFQRFYSFVGEKAIYSYWTPNSSDQQITAYSGTDDQGRPAIRRMKLRSEAGLHGTHDVVVLGHYPAPKRR